MMTLNKLIDFIQKPIVGAFLVQFNLLVCFLFFFSPALPFSAERFPLHSLTSVAWYVPVTFLRDKQRNKERDVSLILTDALPL